MARDRSRTQEEWSGLVFRLLGARSSPCDYKYADVLNLSWLRNKLGEYSLDATNAFVKQHARNDNAWGTYSSDKSQGRVRLVFL